MSFYKNLIVLNGGESGYGQAVGRVKFWMNGSVMRVWVSAALDSYGPGRYYLAVMDADAAMRDFDLGAGSKIEASVEFRNCFNLSRELRCCVAKVDVGSVLLCALGGTGGDSRYPYLFHEYYKTRDYYRPLPAEQPVRGIPEGIEIIDVLSDVTAEVPEEGEGDASKRVGPFEEPATDDLPEPVEGPEVFVSAPEDAMMREDTTMTDLIEEEKQVVECENYYDADYEEKLRLRRIRRYYQPFAPTMPNYDTQCVNASVGILSRDTEDKVEAISRLLDETQPGPERTFYQTVEDQLNKLFNEYGSEEYLEQLISDSRWAKVNYGGGDRFYTVGVIYNGAAPAYICYGIPGEYSETPPKELEGFCEWLPRDMENPKSRGYWMMYQNAKTGESARVGVR